MSSFPRGALWRASLIVAIVTPIFVMRSPSVGAQSGPAILVPANNAVLPAGLDFATDYLGDPWDMSTITDIAMDPAQNKGWIGLGVSAGRVGGTLTTADGSHSGSHISLLERAYSATLALNPGRTGAKFPIDPSVFRKLAFKIGSGRADQWPRIYWFHGDLGDPDGAGWRFADPNTPAPLGDRIYVVDLTQALGANQSGGVAWTNGLVKGLSLYPNSSTTGYTVSFDWVRLTTADSHPSAASTPITWSGGSGTTTIQVVDSGGSTVTVASGLSGTSYTWYYGALPPGTYTLRVIRGGVAAPNRAFRINAPPSLTITDPDETGGEDFATAALGNPWDMNDPADVYFDPPLQDHLISRTFDGQFHGVSDGVSVGSGFPVGDPQVYLLGAPGDPVINTSRYRYLTFALSNDGAYDLERGSVARIFWGSQPPFAYNLTTSKALITWAGMNTYTVDLASLSSGPTGGLEPVGTVIPWTAANVNYLRIDPHEFPEVKGFHIDFVKLAAMDETAPDGSFTVRFTGADADGDSVSVAMYYDTDRNPASGLTLITSAVPLSAGQFTWTPNGVAPGIYYIYAVASDGRNARGTYSTGPLRIAGPTTVPAMSLDAPANGATVTQPFTVFGWAIDRSAPSTTGVDALHVYAYPNPGSGQAPLFLGVAAYGQTRGDVGAAFGSRFTNSGYSLSVDFLKPGPYLLAVYARSTISGTWQVRTASITVQGGPLLTIDAPSAGSTRQQPFTISGWAIDTAASSGTGVNTVHVWAYPNPGSGQAAVFVGAAAYGQSRSDVGVLYGSRFANSGYSLQVRGLSPRMYQFAVFARSTVTGTFNRVQTLTMNVQNTPAMAVDAPSPGTTVSGPFAIRGWAIDLAATAGTGVHAIHVWAYRNPGSGTPAQFLGAATYGSPRGDVGSAFGSSQFTPSGYNLPVSGLASGAYDIVVYAGSTVSGAFDNWRVFRIVVP